MCLMKKARRDTRLVNKIMQTPNNERACLREIRERVVNSSAFIIFFFQIQLVLLSNIASFACSSIIESLCKECQQVHIDSHGL